MKRSLFLQIYLSFLFVILLTLTAAFGSASVAANRLIGVPSSVRVGALLLLQSLPDPSAAPQEFRDGLVRQARRMGAHVSVWSAEGRLLARVGDALPDPPSGCANTWIRSAQGAPGICFQLTDGRWVGAAAEDERARFWTVRITAVFFTIFATIALGCWPLARRITRRLETLQASVERFGDGALQTRATAQGDDEVAAVGRAFNRSADRISALIEQQRRVLAHASHELRSPLARLRMAVALVEDAEERQDRLAAVRLAEREIADLDDLIEDVLLASRLRGGCGGAPAPGPPRRARPVRPACGQGECQPVAGPRGGRGRGPPTAGSSGGNLLSNARRHGRPPIELSVQPIDNDVEISILDRGEGVPAAEQDRIFEPFHRAPGHAEGDPGVGLGLSLVAEIAHHHGGSVRYEDRPDGGSRFVLRLPTHQA